MKKLIIAFIALVAPVYSYAADGLQGYIPSVIDFIYNILVPFVLGIGFLFVVVNIVRYFIIESTNEQGREKAKAYILYSIMAFVLIIVFFGIIDILVTATGLRGVAPTQPDYFGAFGGTGANSNCSTGGADGTFNGGGCGW